LLDKNRELLIVLSLAILSATTRLLSDDDNSLLLERNKVVVGNIAVAERVEVEQIVVGLSLAWLPSDTPAS
jgi:hypothetical protein